uniref:Uncharacterized protein n=1 Tax=Angiostrongylus cantonensis TaxID=6313 RepID=A0A0K0CZI1_ANGCA
MQLEKTRYETDAFNKFVLEFGSLKSELKIEEIKKRMVKREREILKLEEKSHAVANEASVVASFCFKIGVKNIREYEEREMRFQKERIGRMREYDNELERIRGEVGYLRSENGIKKMKQEVDKM